MFVNIARDKVKASRSNLVEAKTASTVFPFAYFKTSIF